MEFEENATIPWQDVIASNVMKRHKKNVVATGITPSGHIHIGNLREVITAEAVHKSLLKLGAESRLIYVADTYDPLRRVYDFLPGSFEKYVGCPISEIPDPFGCCSSYTEHFLHPFLKSLEKAKINIEPYKADELYKSGAFDGAIKTALSARDKIANIIDSVSGKTTPADWYPFNPICENCGRLTTTRVTGFDTESEIVEYACECGQSGTVPIQGGGKLTWRVDWAARWGILGVTVEPFGKDHAAAGSSYDSGKRLAREIFGYEAPYPIPFEHILLKGKGKMSSSRGVTISVEDMVEVLSPGALRYLITRVKPEKHIEFDPGLAMLKFVDEHDELHTGERGFVPFRHMVNAVQIARGDFKQLKGVLQRSGYDTSDEEDIMRRAGNAEEWLKKFAPDIVKFSVQEKMPPSAKSLTDKQKTALGELAESLEKEWTAEDLHDEIYRIAESTGMDAKNLFRAIYISLLGSKSGPRAGWFLVSLDMDFLIKRFNEVSR